MSYITDIHDRQTCPSRRERVRRESDQVLQSLSAFAHAWGQAPESRRRYTERDDALYWFGRGLVAAGKGVTDDLREMERLITEKGLV